MIKSFIEKIRGMIGDSMKIKGMVKLECHDKQGKLLWRTPYSHNIITNDGKAYMALLAGSTGTAFTYLALGTGTTAEAATQTALVTEIVDTNLTRHTAVISRTTTTVTNDTCRLAYTWTASGTKTIEEIGIFNASSTGTMLGRKLTGSKTVNSTEELTATYDIIFS
jgi:hypothetical protein